MFKKVVESDRTGVGVAISLYRFRHVLSMKGNLTICRWEFPYSMCILCLLIEVDCV